MTRLFATDLDGTLLQSGGTLSSENADALIQAQAAGIEVVFVTGRPPRWMDEIRHMTGHSGLALCANGALLLDMATGEYLDAKLIDPDAGMRMIHVLREIDPGMSFAVEVADPKADFIIDHNYRPRWEPLNAPPRMHPEEMLAAGNVVKLLARPSHGSLHDADSILIAAQAVAQDVVDITHSDLTDLLLEMSALGVNKGSGLAQVAASRNINREDVAAVGDMPNDVPMITWAGRGAAVANAHDWVKAAADEHLPSNDEHGVAVFINRLISGE